MSITITGGITFGNVGGVSIIAPPSVATAGWFAGGASAPGQTSTVQRITFATDTATASVRGPLSSANSYRAGGAGNLNYGWYGGGSNSSLPAPSRAISSVDRITYATDTATATARGSLSSSRYFLAATGNQNYGWFGPGLTTLADSSIVNRITYATDTATASSRGKLVTQRSQYSATGNDNYGYFAGGSSIPGSIISSIDRIDYANDTAIATATGPLSSNRNAIGATSDSTYGWFAGGYLSPNPLSTVDRITFANDTATATVRGPLNAVRQGPQGVGDNVYGWFATDNSYTLTVSRITYATDTATATARGPLSVGSRMVASTSGIQ